MVDGRCPDMSKRLSRGQHRYGADAHGVYCMGVHTLAPSGANTIEPSMCGGDAALCQITLTTCYLKQRTEYAE